MGLIIRSWGLDGYAAFILIKLLTPIGYFNILDFGMFDSTVRNIAKYRSSVKEINQVFPISLLYITCVGALTALLIFFLGEQLLEFLGLNEAVRFGSESKVSWAMFLVIIQIPLFIMLFLESVLKGYEKFLLLRLIDLFAVLSCLILLMIWPDNGMELWIFIFAYYAFLGFKLITLLLFLAYSDIRLYRFSSPSVAVRKDVFKHSSTMGVGKLISTTVENFPLIVLSGLGNLELAGAFDAIMRIPRFIKSVMGAVNNVIVPYAAALSKFDFDYSKASLVILTTKYQSIVFAPLLIIGLIFSEQILFFWIGQEYVAYSARMKLCFIVPIMILCIGATSSVSISDQKILKALNYINMIRLFIYVLLSFVLLKYFTLEAFIYANIISYGFCEIFTLRLFRHHFRISIMALIKPVLLSGTISSIILTFGHSLLLWIGMTDIFYALVAVGCLLIAVWFALYSLGLSSLERHNLVTMMRNQISNG